MRQPGQRGQRVAKRVPTSAFGDDIAVYLEHERDVGPVDCLRVHWGQDAFGARFVTLAGFHALRMASRISSYFLPCSRASVIAGTNTSS